MYEQCRHNPQPVNSKDGDFLSEKLLPEVERFNTLRSPGSTGKPVNPSWATVSKTTAFTLPGSVMVAQQILILLVKVRALAG